MKKSSVLRLFLLCFIIFGSSQIFAQEVNIIPYLKQIENGRSKEVENKLPELKKEYPNSSSVLFLQGVLTMNAQDALPIYRKILKKYPHSKYADAALYRIYSYYYALGLYKNAKEKLTQLKTQYPDSPYLNIIDKKIPNKDEKFPSTKSKVNPVTNKAEPSHKIESDKDYKFTIQAGAFSVIGNAKSLKKDFEDAGYYSKIKDKVVAGTTFHVVYVGKFETQKSADSFLYQINKQFNLKGRVVNINN